MLRSLNSWFFAMTKLYRCWRLIPPAFFLALVGCVVYQQPAGLTAETGAEISGSAIIYPGQNVPGLNFKLDGVDYKDAGFRKSLLVTPGSHVFEFVAGYTDKSVDCPDNMYITGMPGVMQAGKSYTIHTSPPVVQGNHFVFTMWLQDDSGAVGSGYFSLSMRQPYAATNVGKLDPDGVWRTYPECR